MNNFFKLVAFGFFTIIFLLLFHYIGWLGPVENTVIKVFSPAQRSFYLASSSIKNFNNRWVEKRDLLYENEELKKEIKEIKINQSRVNSLEEENNILKKELNFTKEYELKTVSAKIITGVSDSFSQSVVINRGSNDGIEKGMAVVVEDGIMIGKIYEVYADNSKVLLLTDNKSRVAATIQNLGQTTGLVEGQFGLSLSMTNIPQDQEIKEGDLIVTSGLEGKIPKNLLIAEVESVNQIESEIFKTAILNPIIPFDNLSFVLVIFP